MDMLTRVTPSQLAHHEGNQGMKMAIAELSLTLSMESADQAPKITQLNRMPQDRLALKLLVAVLRVFVDSVKVERKLDPVDVLTLADSLLHLHPLESIEDFILALKDARSQRYYAKLDESDILLVVEAYFKKKVAWRETKNLDQKAQSTSLPFNAIHQLQQVAPHLVESLSLRIDPSHPNADSHRDRLSLIQNRERRGYLSPEQARLQRAALACALIRNPRRDWGRRKD